MLVRDISSEQSFRSLNYILLQSQQRLLMGGSMAVEEVIFYVLNFINSTFTVVAILFYIRVSLPSPFDIDP